MIDVLLITVPLNELNTFKASISVKESSLCPLFILLSSLRFFEKKTKILIVLIKSFYFCDSVRCSYVLMVRRVTINNGQKLDTLNN